MEGIENIQKTVEEFRSKAADFQTTFRKNFKITRIFKYLKIVKEREGNLACENFYHEILSAYGKFLQIIVVYLTFNGEHHRLEKVFSKFNKDYQELSGLFSGIQEIPEGKEVILKRQEAIKMVTADLENLTMEVVKDEKKVPMRRQETVKRTKAGTKEEFNAMRQSWPTLRNGPFSWKQMPTWASLKRQMHSLAECLRRSSRRSLAPTREW